MKGFLFFCILDNCVAPRTVVGAKRTTFVHATVESCGALFPRFKTCAYVIGVSTDSSKIPIFSTHYTSNLQSTLTSLWLQLHRIICSITYGIICIVDTTGRSFACIVRTSKAVITVKSLTSTRDNSLFQTSATVSVMMLTITSELHPFVF
jgi:hypothetical protein